MAIKCSGKRSDGVQCYASYQDYVIKDGVTHYYCWRHKGQFVEQHSKEFKFKFQCNQCYKYVDKDISISYQDNIEKVFCSACSALNKSFKLGIG